MVSIISPSSPTTESFLYRPALGQEGLNTPILNTPTAATHDWLLWTANHMQGPHQPHMIFFFFQKSKILKKYFFFKNFLSFFEKKNILEKSII